VLGQEASPLVEWPVRGEPERAALVGGGDEAEQQLRAGVVERGEADFVDLSGVRTNFCYAFAGNDVHDGVRNVVRRC
jgi:hypothetical protein